ncbi:AIPR family protein [Demequina mangrovi]|uniref:AIPR protein n=1 Tax=Demequina mangrovi TaxID=1043493 RepID=A0A1H6ZP17_9MICO|nr:AIPR family protein [Demequina mangrovi]SEJ51350.1 AIPR protein [Demequina mangrovi]
MPDTTATETTPLDAALEARDDLNRYGRAKRALFALQLSFGLDDIHTIAASALTDGPDDKSCDVVYVDRDLHTAVLVQGYESTAPTNKRQARGAKASSVHQAITWLLGDIDEADVPERLRSARNELHQALADGAIASIEVWFVHNLPESAQIKQELNASAVGARHMVSARYSGVDLDVSGTEIGLETLGDRYLGSLTPVLVTDPFVVPVSGAFTEKGENWTAVCTSLPAGWLHEQFAAHKERLFSANVRGYLGSTRSQNNINNGIQDTVRNEPQQFWAYNNGITALVNDFEYDEDAGTIRVEGLAIVNGAQTTGSIGSLDSTHLAESRVMARFIKCDDQRTVQEIIRFNNRQNPTQAADFRSNDRVQSRLVKEFEKLGVVGYNGGRRGGAEDVIRRPGSNQILATVAAQALAAFHGRPEVAYHQKGQIWEDDAIYSSVFPDRTSAAHILFVCALLRAIEEKKLELSSAASLDLDDSELAAWFSLRGSNMLALTAMGAVFETVLNRTIADKYALAFQGSPNLQEAADKLKPALDAVLALAPSQLSDALSGSALRNKAKVDTALATFRGLVRSTKTSNRHIYTALGNEISLNQ